jgi:energy-coupling factor transporter ATP-binding protein EcfA2
MTEEEQLLRDDLSTVFHEFRSEPYNRFIIKLRRTRAAQVRELLADPTAVTPEIFDREIWRLESETLLSGHPIKISYLWETWPAPSSVADLDNALDSGQLELHGNYIWGSGSGRYAPKIQDDAVRAANIGRALSILRDTAHTPPEKAHEIMNIPGFGANSASGLVMVTYPNECALFNQQSTEALRMLGYNTATFDDFQRAAAALRDALEAEDFLELDWFLYLGNQGVVPVVHPTGFWWVNQGESYDQERARGYVFATKRAEDGRRLANHERLRDLRPGHVTFHYAEGEIRALGKVTSPAVEVDQRDDTPQPSGSGQSYRAGINYVELQRPIERNEIPLEWRVAETAVFEKTGKAKQQYLMPLSPAFVEKLVQQFDLPLPQRVPAPHNYWLFQANAELFSEGDPHHYDLKRRVRDVVLGQEDAWRVMHSAAEMRPGDKLILWQGGHGPQAEDAGIYALGELASLPYITPRARDAQGGSDGNEAEQTQVDFVYTHLFPEPIRRTTLREHPTLKGLQVLRGPMGTNFRVTQEEWNALQQLIATPVIPPASATSAFDTLRAALAARGLYFPPEMISNYLLALQTKRFVILTGISGTGKTQLALKVAEAMQPQAPVTKVTAVAVEAEEVVVSPSMLKRGLLTLPVAVIGLLNLAASDTPPNERRIVVAYPNGSSILTYWRAANRNVTQLHFDERLRAWFKAEFQEGDRFFIEVIKHEDGHDSLRFSKPATIVRTERLSNYEVIAVRPDWTDNRGLLGYYNPLTQSYSPTPFLRLLLNAAADVKHAEQEGRDPYPFFAILDEMNLARVEHYFSDFLSAIESGEPLHLHDDERIEAGESEDGIIVPRRLSVPPNLLFTGTVNVDETTYMFSPKVLDRAFTIEFNTVDLRRLGGSRPADNEGLSLTKFSGKLAGLPAPSSVDWQTFSRLEGGKLSDLVVELHELLEAEGRHFGYRVANEIARFVLLARQQSDGSSSALRAALDLALLEKVLPKFHGTQQEIQEPLVALFDFAVVGKRRTTLLTEGEIEHAWTVRRERLEPVANTGEQQTLTLPRTAEKIWIMLKRLRQQGFTSFIT